MIAEAEQTVLHIFFGSQTGTAEQEANLFELQCRERGFQTLTTSLDDFPLEKFPEIQYAVFFVSTTGQGDPPKNMERFWNFILTKSLPADSLAGLRFSVFGFGDSSYRKYNVMARMLYQRLQQLGAASFHERGLGDDRAEGGYNLALVKWKKSFFESLCLRFNSKQPANACYSGLQRPPKPVFSAHVNPANNLGLSIGPDSPETVLSKVHGKPVAQSTVKENRRLTAADHFQDVREIIIDKPESQQFVAGAVCTIHPSNSPSVVASLLKYYSLDPADRVELTRENGSSYLSTTAGHLFNFVLDLSSAPKFFFFKLLSFYTALDIYKEKIEEMEFEDYYTYAIRERRTLDEILFDFKGISLPLDILVSFIGFLKPRDYSIASSCKKNPSIIRLTVALVEYSTASNRKITGVCSRHFSALAPGAPVYYQLKQGTLAFPADDKTPVIVIGPGTGIAPFISLLEERESAGPMEAMSRFRTLVFFGCRNREKDFLHREYLSELQKSEKITLFTAFSRDQDSKVYVQHVIRDNSFRLKSFLQEYESSLRIYVAGNSKDMPQAVEKALRQVFGEAFGEKGEEVYERLAREERIQFETWG